MVIHRTLLLAAMLLSICAVSATGNPAQDQDKDQLPPNYVPTGGQIFKQYCAACHGVDAKGHGPVGRVLRKPAPDLTTLAKRHGGKFPYDYVMGMLSFTPGVSSHGSGDMPTWGALFEYYYDKKSAQQRIQNVSDYLASLQEK